MLPDFVAEHWQDVVRLDYRSGFVRRKVWWVSVRVSERASEWNNRMDGYYLILLQCIGKMVCSLFTDFILGKVKCGKCLCRIMIGWEDEKVRPVNATRFCCRALARWYAPCSPIWFRIRFNRISVCIRK
jgi:hypothetical protein